MNKFGIFACTALGTLGVVAGGVAIAVNTPQIKDKLSVSFDGQTIVGVEEPSTPGASSDIEKLGYVAVEYVDGDNSSIVLQKKGSAVERVNTPQKDGYVFMGWSTTEDGKNMISNVEENCKLYPVFIEESDIWVTVHNTNGGTQSTPLSSFDFGQINSYTQHYSIGLVGFSTSKDKIEFVTDIDPDTTYYSVYYCLEEDKIYSFAEMNDLIAYSELGEMAFYTITVNSPDGTSVEVMVKDFYQSDYGFELNDYYFSAMGLSNSPTSTETVNNVYVDGADYYLVYNYRGNLYSYNDVINLVENGSLTITVIGVDNTFNDQLISFSLSNMSLWTPSARFNAIGLSTSSSSSVVDVESYSEGVTYYVIYENSDTGERYSYDAMSELYTEIQSYVTIYKADGSTYSGLANNFNLTDMSIVISDVTYNAIGFTFDPMGTTPEFSTSEELEPGQMYWLVYQNESDSTVHSYEEIFELYQENQ